MGNPNCENDPRREGEEVMITDYVKKLLIIAYGSGKEDGHSETVEGAFWGDGHSKSHDADASEWLGDALNDGTFNRNLEL